MEKWVTELRNLRVDVEERREKIKELRANQNVLIKEHDDIKQKVFENRSNVSEDEAKNAKAKLEGLNQKRSKMEDEIGALENEISSISENIKKIEERNKTFMENRYIYGLGNEEHEERAKEYFEKRQGNIGVMEIRSTLLSSGGIAKPKAATGVNEMFPDAITFMDRVNISDMTGVSENTVSFQKTRQTASEKTDGVAVAESDATFGTVIIKPTLVSTLSYISKNISKQTPLQYYEKVKDGSLKALKIKLAELITKGNGTSFKGVLNSVDSDASPKNMFEKCVVNSNKIDEKFLRNLVLSYGGDVNAYGGEIGILCLNKKDLIAFGDIRGTSEKKAIYEIIPDGANPNTGIIKEGGFSVRYVIDKNCKALTEQTVPADSSEIQTMYYGIPTNYELDLFGNYEITESRDYKFAEGLIAIMGEVMAGGSVTVDKGFSVVTLKKA